MLELDVTGMTCSHCVRAVTQAVRTVDPEAEVQIDLAAKRVRIQGRSKADELIRVLRAAGYTARSAGG
ncbi:MAG TPA: heavy-metal-associated domain-containing protein [Burkholderiales bacterium]|nr:heavy-metal-associated domain-containing protein [Burkholderiales bacterium]